MLRDSIDMVFRQRSDFGNTKDPSGITCRISLTISSLHHSFDLMSSPTDYIFMKPLDKNFSWSSSTFWVLPGYQLNSWWEIPSLPLDELCYHRQLYCLPSNTNLFAFCVIPWVPCYPTFVLLYLGVLPSLMSRMFWDLFHLLRILDIEILLSITILSWSPC